jgi:RNA polymerase sigma-70 factor (ECF subfamily)
VTATENKKYDLDPSRWLSDHGDYLFSFAMSRINKKDIAEDMVQETLLSAYRAKDKFRGGSSERTWLVSILKRKVIDHFRKQARNPETPTEEFSMPFHKGGSKNGQWMMEHAPASWSEEILQDDGSLMEIIQYCISLLSPRMAATFNMKTLEDISTEDICKELGISESNLWVLMHRARLQLRECVEDNWFKDR